jgi:ricin-type beta-trefoil lectin protein
MLRKQRAVPSSRSIPILGMLAVTVSLTLAPARGVADTATTSKTAATDPHARGIWYLKVKHSGKCITVHGASQAQGATVDQYSCVGQANQRWRVLVIDVTSSAAEISYIIAENSGKCMDVQGGSTAKGARVIQWTCNSRPNQQYSIKQTLAGTFIIRPIQAHDKCLDVEGASTANNARLIQWTCNDNTNQQFELVRA